MLATTCIQPIDMVKVRVQVAGELGTTTNPFAIAKNVVAESGVKGLYAGLDSALLRQAVYATARLGLYSTFTDMVKAKNNGEVSTGWKVACSFAAGGLGAAIGNPCDLSLVRFQADSTLPADQRRNYKNVFDALNRIVTEEGFFSLWKGVGPTVARAISLNVAMLVTNDEAKQIFLKMWGPCFKTTFAASFVSGIFTAVGSLPFDNLKTKMQKMKADPKTGKLPYTSLMDCMTKTIQREGVTGLWTGLPTYYFRVAPHAMITLLAMSGLRDLFGVKQ